MVKRKHIVRKYFKLTKNAQGKKKVACPYCNWTSCVNATRMHKHMISECKKVPRSIRDEVNKLCPPKRKKYRQPKLAPRKKNGTAYSDSDTEDEDEVEDERMEGEATSSATASSQKVPVYSVSRTNNAFYDTMDEKNQKHLESLMAKAMYATATPFSRFEHPYWQDFYTALRPCFKVPSRKMFSSTLLTSEYDSCKISVEEKVALSESLALGTDGWTNGNRSSIVNILLFTPDPIFLTSIESGTERHTGQMFFEKLDPILKERGPEKFFAVITDNAANMKLGGRLIEEKYPHICWYGCSMHGLHLLMQDISTKIQFIADTLKECHSITTEILGKPNLLAIFKEKQKEILKDKAVSLKVPCDTRFGSKFRCMKCVMINQGTLRALCIDPRVTVRTGNKVESLIDEGLKKAILSDEIWRKIEAALEVLKPIYNWLFYVQSDTTYISEIPMCFKDIQLRITSVTQESEFFDHADANRIDDLISERKDFCLRNIHLAAALLDPAINNDEYLSSEDKDTAIAFIDKLAVTLPNVSVDKVSEDLLEFLSKTGKFSAPHLWRKTKKSAHLWWKAFCSHTELSKIALKILPLPASSGAVERSFNSQGHIHSKRRNRLVHGKTEKLVYLYENHRALQGAPKKAKRRKLPTAEEEVMPVFNGNDGESEVEVVMLSDSRSDSDDSRDLEELIDEVSEDDEEVYYEQPFVSDDD